MKLTGDKVVHRMTSHRRIGLTAAAGFLLVQATGPAMAGAVWLPESAGARTVSTRSLQESKFSKVVRQQYDFSCGSAALATLLTFHYGRDTNEQDAFAAMYAAGDKEKIAKAGFSLLDMKTYLDSMGLKADGYQSSLETLANAGIPAIALINYKGYRHFVVVKGIKEDQVLIGDPALGIKLMSRGEFTSLWDNGVLFIIKNKPEIGQRHFNQSTEWNLLARAPLGTALSTDSLGQLTVGLPRIGDF